MARPTYYPDWATDDVNLPSTGNTNKVRPREAIRTTGWDKGQIPTAEELNWTLNNLGEWIHYVVDDYSVNNFLPKDGTSLTFSGDLTGTISWAGTNVGTGNIQVNDNSHNHLSSNITDATNLPTENMIAKRASDGSMWTGRAHYVSANDGKNADYFLTGSGQDIAGSLNYSQENNLLTLYKGTTSAQQSYIQLTSSVVNITFPRATNSQEGVGNALVRYDYLTQQVSNISTIITNLTNYSNQTFVQDIRLGTRVTIAVGGDMVTFPTGCVATSASGDSDTSIQAQYAPIQKNINGTWYTVSG